MVHDDGRMGCLCGGSCKNEVDDVFDRDATSRIEAAITECEDMLQSSEYGWRFDYTPTTVRW